MNYLAYPHLGGPQPAQLLDSLYGDFVKGRPQGRQPDEIERTIQPHRRIGASIDSHSLAYTAERCFPLERRRFAGVLLDVFFDHCLARGWNDYADEPPPQFVERVYGTLRTASPPPEHLARITPRMVAQDQLGSYRGSAVLREVLGGTSWRLSRPHLLDGSWEELIQRHDGLNTDFRTSYLQLQTFALSQR